MGIRKLRSQSPVYSDLLTHPELYERLKKGTWWHERTGAMYRLVSISNLTAGNRIDYPVMACYTNIEDGSEWCKNLGRFLDGMTFLEPNE